jgi:hypothetical protein
VKHDNALETLNVYCKKTKVVFLEETMAGTMCKMTYQSILRKISVTGVGNCKKAARKTAAFMMVEALKE